MCEINLNHDDNNIYIFSEKCNMCAIKKINILKLRQQKIINAFKEIDPLGFLPQTHVTESGLTISDIKDKINKISDCASILELQDTHTKHNNSAEQILKVVAANYCKQHAVCPICANRTQARRRARYNDPIREQARMVLEGKRYAYMITYTVRDCTDLGERLEHLKKSKKAFRRMGQKRQSGTRSKGEAGKIRAAISTTEIKRGEGSKLWHVHCHDLVFTDKPLDYVVYDKKKRQELSKKYNRIPAEKLLSTANKLVKFQGKTVASSKISLEWFQATNGDSINISVDPLQHVPKKSTGKKRRMFKKMSFEDSITYQSKEVLKYIHKPNENNIDDLLVILDKTYNKRMVATYGQFRNVSGDDYNDKSTETDTEKDSFVMIWKEGTYQDAQPGQVRSVSESEIDTRSMVARMLGEYRRQRRHLLNNRDRYGESLSELLNNMKQQFKCSVSAAWNLYRSTQNTAERIKNAYCDKYSPTLAAKGLFLPGSTSNDVYAAVFC